MNTLIDITRLEQVLTKINEAINSSGGGSSIPNPLPVSMGGTGNSDGYIRTGQKANTTMGQYATAEGYQTEASGRYSHAEGEYTTASGSASHAEGWDTTASGFCSHAEGNWTTASGSYSHAEGANTTASALYSHAEGIETTASGNFSHVGGQYTIAAARSQMVIGEFNVEKGMISSAVQTDALFMIGKGTSDTTRANAFRVGQTKVWGGTYSSSGADYAEMFEWEDGNPNDEDRVGRFVTLDGEFIRYPSEEETIFGITSANPSVCGDIHDDQWQGMYLTDVFGRPIYEDVVVPEEKDDEGNIIIPEHTESRQKLNPEYDNTQVYQARSHRSEWAAVGLVGKLVVLQDGSLSKNDYVKSGIDGIATRSETPTRVKVMRVIDDTHAKVFISPSV